MWAGNNQTNVNANVEILGVEKSKHIVNHPSDKFLLYNINVIMQICLISISRKYKKYINLNMEFVSGVSTSYCRFSLSLIFLCVYCMIDLRRLAR